jgi:hypothetical protein
MRDCYRIDMDVREPREPARASDDIRNNDCLGFC